MHLCQYLFYQFATPRIILSSKIIYPKIYNSHAHTRMKNKTMRYFLIFTLMITANISSATENSLNHTNCIITIKTENKNDLRSCGENSLKHTDSALNKAWQEKQNEWPDSIQDSKKTLLSEQRKWIAFKENACQYYLHNFHHIGRDILFYACQQDILIERTAYLQNLLKYEEGVVGYAPSPSNQWAENPLYGNCMMHAQNDGDFAQCAEEHLEHLDAELNQAWSKVYKPLTNEKIKAALLNEQRKWIAFKESACLYYFDDGFGSADRVMSFPACQSNIIGQRIKALWLFSTFNYPTLAETRLKQAFNALSEAQPTKEAQIALLNNQEQWLATREKALPPDDYSRLNKIYAKDLSELGWDILSSLYLGEMTEERIRQLQIDLQELSAKD